MYKGMKYSFLLIIKIYLYPLLKKCRQYFISCLSFWYFVYISKTFHISNTELTKTAEYDFEIYFGKVFYYLPDVKVFSVGTSIDNICTEFHLKFINT